MPHKRILHDWIVAPYQQDRISAQKQAEVVSYAIDCHRNHRGPYTGARELLRFIVPDACLRVPDLVRAHAITILCIAPEMQAVISASEELTRSFTFTREGIYNSRLWTLRLAHGLVDFLLAYFSRTNSHPCSISLENVHLSDPLDQEFIAVFLRRANPEILFLTINTSSDLVTEPLQSALKTYAQIIQLQPMTMDEQRSALSLWAIADPWARWLLQYTNGWRGEWQLWQYLVQELDLAAIQPEASSLEECLYTLVTHLSSLSRYALAQAYVVSDCTSDNLLQKAAYSLLDPLDRQQLHKDRASVLETSNQRSFFLGAIPSHHEHAGIGIQALASAFEYCTVMGYYEAVLDFGYRGRKLIDWKKQPEQYSHFTRGMILAFLLLGRFIEAERLCAETQALTDNPTILMHCAYFMAILHARFYDEGQRNYHLSKLWAKKAISFAELLPKSDGRTIDIIFLKNTLALSEMRTGHPHEALQMLSEGLKRLKEEMPGKYEEVSVFLLYNRARVYTAIGQLEFALEDYTTLIRHMPGNSEAYFDRGNIRQRLGRHQEALEDYNSAIRWSPPYPEVYYNRARLLAILEQHDKALDDYNYALVLDPEFVPALINRAILLYEGKDYASSRKDVERGLTLDTGNAQLFCLLGLLEMEEHHSKAAYRAFSAALEKDSSLLAAWTNRAILLFEEGNAAAAIEDLTHALSLSEDATILYNRALAYQSQKRWQEAIDDYSHALALSKDDEQTILSQRNLCYQAIGNSEQAYLNVEAHLALASHPQ